LNALETKQEIIERINILKKELQQLKKELLKPDYFVYCHILPNNKYYIGVAKDLEKRWAKGEGYKANKPLYNAIQKYGWDNVKHIIIQDYKEKRCAESAENLLIYVFNASNKHFGYNRASYLGNIGTNEKERTEELEHIQKIRKIKKENLKQLQEAYQRRKGAKICE